jgi:hypothetical protein
MTRYVLSCPVQTFRDPNGFVGPSVWNDGAGIITIPSVIKLGSACKCKNTLSKPA